MPKCFYKGLVVPKDEFAKYNMKMSDAGIDYIFSTFKCKKIKAKYSRLYCDVERYRNDCDEVMSRYGQGVVYTHTFDGKLLHVHDERYKRKALRYYDRYHRKVNRIVNRALHAGEEVLIIDCHSFSDEVASHIRKPPFADVCIGIEEGRADDKTLNRIIERVNSAGLTYAINYPYSGSFLPSNIPERLKSKVKTIMIELNKRIYL